MIVEKAIFEARANELEQFIDSFGTNHTIETGLIPVMTLNLPKDFNIDMYPYADDEVEPVALEMDAWSCPLIKPINAFEQDNIVDTEYI